MITYKGRQIPETFEEIVNPLHTALIVHEMRNDLREIGSFDKHGNTIRIDFDSILAPIARLLEAARDKHVRVMYAGYIGHSTEGLYSDVMVWRHHRRLLDPQTAPVAPGVVEEPRVAGHRRAEAAGNRDHPREAARRLLYRNQPRALAALERHSDHRHRWRGCRGGHLAHDFSRHQLGVLRGRAAGLHPGDGE